MGLNPIVLMQGDDSTRRGACMVRDTLFNSVNFVEVDVGVHARVQTDDRCIQDAADAVTEYGHGIKISTASDDPQMKKRGWKSANIVLRPMLDAIGMWRQTMAPGNYQKPVAVFRYGSGGFYNETSCVVSEVGGVEFADIHQRMILTGIETYANMAVDRAQKHGMQIVYVSKRTISEGERLLPERCEQVFRKRGLNQGRWRGDGDFYHELTDMAAAFMPTNVGPKEGSMVGNRGGWMVVCDNPNGDTLADVADMQHGGNSMGSEVICLNPDGTTFSYFELPGGTAPGRKDSDFKGKNFFAPMGTLAAFTGAISGANLGLKPYCDAVMAAGVRYMAETQEPDRDTQTMLDFCAAEAKPHWPSEV